ncbi:MAG: hypothetical protein ABR80_02340 [Cryomorphaceae bacterium BACL11 MAG-121015-bin20]|jgi:hypothetical protein|nr:MAG: hypothetical protein ABR80_02340 [Cryomorphaceae bacterium BACL11 MAG-121015-bin20]
MKFRHTLILFCFISNFSYSQCLNADSLYTNNITYSNALANWNHAPIANHYIIHYRILGTTNWNNLANISGNDTTRNIPGLNPLTSYEWQIKTYCDTSNQPNSGWSYSDTFTTTSFVAAPFNPIINKTLGSLECNAQNELFLSITQEENEPDIGTGTIISDGGYFNINTINTNDSVGYATITTATQSIASVLRAGIILGTNYAIINSYDSTGSLIGFFTIENDNGGVKIEILGSPNDGNNYTSGYVSELYFTNLFVNPQNAGPLHFFTDINSELNDQLSATDTVQIWCNTTGIISPFNPKKINTIFDILGRENQIQLNTIQIIKFSDGTTEKRVFIKK